MSFLDLAPRGLERRLRFLDLGLGGQVLALSVVHFLLRHQAGLSLRHAVQPVVLEVQDGVLRLHAAERVLGVPLLIRRVLDGSVILSQLELELGDLEHAHHLSRFHMRSIVYVELPHVARLFGVDIDLLEGNQLGRNRETAFQRLRRNLGDRYRNGVRAGVRRRAGAGPR